MVKRSLLDLLFSQAFQESQSVADIVVKDILDAGVHFGHRTSRWNPKMRPYIYGRRNLIHIIDIKETVRGVMRARRYLQQVAGQGSLVLFVGTKRQAADPVAEAAESCKMPYVTERWLGGTLTNFRTIRSRLKRLEELEQLQESGELATYSKKMQSTLMREYRKTYRNLNGMRHLNRLPEALVVIDPKKEHNAVREARSIGAKVVALIDTDSDPDTVDLPIPGNDDSIRSIRLMLQYLSDAVQDGRSQLPEEPEKKKADEPKPVPSL
jgi:small subunit ribosomal protein S2